jgi:hypothetical protein
VKYADKYFTIKRNDHAIAKLEEMLKQNPNSALAQRELSEKLYSDGQVARATEQYSKLIENPNHFASDEVRYLTLLYFNKDYEKGYTQATKILSKDSDNFTARRFQYIFANLLDKDNKVELAEQLVALKSDKNKFATGDYSMIATDFIKAGKTDEALALLETGMKDYPEENGILKGAADAYKNAEMYDKAADTLSQYTASQGSNVNGQDLWSLSNYALIAGTKTTDQTQIDKYFNMSSDAAKQAIDKFADESKYMAAMRIADVAKYSKKESEALAAYEQAATLMENAGVTDDTKSAKNIYRYLTVGYYNKHDNAKAKQYLNKYLQYDSNDADINKIKNALK